MVVPVRSAGNRSGVNWIRLNWAATILASVATVRVLASPGTPSRRMWPLHNSPIRIRSTMARWPTMTRSISRKMRSTTALSRWTCSLMA